MKAARAVVAALCCAACTDGSRADDTDAATRADGAVQDARRPDAAGGGPDPCGQDATPPAPGAVCVTSVTGRLVDENDASSGADVLVSVCGPTQCEPAWTGADGRFTVTIGQRIVPGIHALQAHVRPDRTAFYFPLPKSAAGPDVDLGDLRTLAMPAAGPLLAVDRAGAPAQSVTSDDVTLDVPDGAYVRLDAESNLAQDHGREFRALRIPEAFIPEFTDPALAVFSLFAFEPFEVTFEQGGSPGTLALARLSFANVTALPAGTAVEVLAEGSFVFPSWIPVTEFTKVALAHVSADGTRIDMDPAEGVTHLTWAALRRAP